MRPLGLPVGLPVTSVGLLVLRVRDGDGGGGGGDGGIRRRDSPFNCIGGGRVGRTAEGGEESRDGLRGRVGLTSPRRRRLPLKTTEWIKTLLPLAPSLSLSLSLSIPLSVSLPFLPPMGVPPGGR